MKLTKLIDERFQNTLSRLMQEPLPLKTAFKLKGIVKKIQEELVKYEEVRKLALTKYGKKNKDGSLILSEGGVATLEGDDRTSFIKELNELLALEIDLDQVSLNDLGNDIKLSTEDLIVIEDLFLAE